jgi:hypothetical protein
MSHSSVLAQGDRIRSRIIKRYEQLDQDVKDGTIDPLQAFLEHLSFQDMAPELDAIAEEAMSP